MAGNEGAVVPLAFQAVSRYQRTEKILSTPLHSERQT